MKPAVRTPTAKELIDELGAIPAEDKNPDIVGLIINGRIIWANVRHLHLVEETMGAAIIKADERRRGPRLPVKPVVLVTQSSHDRPLGEAPPMKFIDDFEEEPIVQEESDLPPMNGFEMPEREHEFVPKFLENVRGLATNHNKPVEAWE
jgi:hypothetical protein